MARSPKELMEYLAKLKADISNEKIKIYSQLLALEQGGIVGAALASTLRTITEYTLYLDQFSSGIRQEYVSNPNQINEKRLELVVAIFEDWCHISLEYLDKGFGLIKEKLKQEGENAEGDKED